MRARVIDVYSECHGKRRAAVAVVPGGSSHLKGTATISPAATGKLTACQCHPQTRASRTTTAMQSKAATVAEYIASLPADRRAAIEAVRAVMNANLDTGYAEGMYYGMIMWYVPHASFPDGY